MGSFNLIPFIISRGCEIFAFLICIFMLILYTIRIRQERSNGHFVKLIIQLHTYGIMLIVIIQNAFNSTTSWLFILVPSIKNQSDHTETCQFKQYTNFILAALFRFLLYQFFILRMRMALADSALKYPRCVIYFVRFLVLMYCLIYVYLGVTHAKIISFPSFDDGFDCYYQFKDATLWGLGTADTLLSFLCSYLFIRKLLELHKLTKYRHRNSGGKSRTSYIYDPTVSKSQSTIVKLPIDDDEILKQSMGRFRKSIHSALTAHDKYKHKKEESFDLFDNRMAQLPMKITLLWLLQFITTWLLFYLGFTPIFQFLGWFVPINGVIDVLCVYWCFRFNDKFFYGKCIPCIEQLWLCSIQYCFRYICCCCCDCCYNCIRLDDRIVSLSDSRTNSVNTKDFVQGDDYIPLAGGPDSTQRA